MMKKNNSNFNSNQNVINYPFIDYIVKVYVPELQFDDAIYRGVDMDLFLEAMTHYTASTSDFGRTYDRLEYLGDAIFHLLITEYFYKRYDDQSEGFLTRLRIRTERGDSMVELAYCLDLVNYIISYVVPSDDIIEDVFEAFIGAFYLNFGMKYTRVLTINLIEKHKDLASMIHNDDNYKDLLLRYFHQKKWGHPKYIEERASNGKFISMIKNPQFEIIGKGVAGSKSKAEQFASKAALVSLGVIVNNEIDHDWINKIDKIEKEAKKKEITDRKPIPIFNPVNQLITSADIKEILLQYDIVIPRAHKLNIKLFHEATTHKSYIMRKKLPGNQKPDKSIVKLQKKSNERLQFLGDSVIHFVIGEHLFGKYPKNDEGFLTRLRSKLENRDSLFYLAKQTGIDKYIIVSQYIEILHGRNNVNIIGGGFEAFIGALYLDIGLQLVRELIISIIRNELDIDRIAAEETNYKELVMQFFNKNQLGYPDYKVIHEEGPDNAKIFTMGLYYEGKLYSQGTASSKKKATQIAAKKMYNDYIKNAILA